MRKLKEIGRGRAGIKPATIRGLTVSNLEVPDDAISALCRRHHIRKLSFFGSVLRDDFGPDSDVDLLIEFEPGYERGFFGLFDIEQELSAVLESL